jgi:hypothetical protein
MRRLVLFVGAFISVMACTPSAPSLTATTAAPPTTAPTIQPTIVPTVPPATAIPESTTAPAPSGACDHPYFPVGSNSRWSYRVQGAVASDFIETHMPTSPTGFTVRMAFPDVSVDNEWRCGPDGLTALQASRVSTAQTQLRFVSTSVTGVTFPPADRWTPGSSWTTAYEVEGDPSAIGGNPARGRITVTSTVAGEESVSVPASSYTAMKISQHTTLDLSVTVRDFSAPISISFEATSWFARGVGMVKTVGGGELGESTTELTAYTP